MENKTVKENPWAIAIHGGAGVISPTIELDKRAPYIKALEETLQIGVEILKNGGSAIDAVVCFYN